MLARSDFDYQLLTRSRKRLSVTEKKLIFVILAKSVTFFCTSTMPYKIVTIRQVNMINNQLLLQDSFTGDRCRY